jgi:hypothetical protein
MSKTKSPFRGLEIEEVLRAEGIFFVIQIGNDYYNKDGNFTFERKEAERHYNTLLKNIMITIDKGTDRQKNAAMKCLARLHILPLRLQ